MADSLAKSIVQDLSRINVKCDHNRALAKAIMPIRLAARKMGIGHYLTKAAYANDPERLERQEKRKEDFRAFCELHKEELEKASEMLEDDFSRLTLEKVMEYRRTEDKSVLEGICVQPQYFLKDIFTPAEDEVFVDGGAYVGETVESFLKDFTGGYKRIYTWEPDEANMVAMKKNLKDLDNIVYVPCGMWDKETELYFTGAGTTRARIVEANSQIADELDPDENVGIKVNSIDNVCSEDKVTFIKMDIEGSELTALNGAVNVIKRDKPRLAICIYHKPEDLYEIPFWVKQTVPEYKIYIRHHTDSATETVLYATL